MKPPIVPGTYSRSGHYTTGHGLYVVHSSTGKVVDVKTGQVVCVLGRGRQALEHADLLDAIIWRERTKAL